jgi:hypothetical protein
MARVLVTGLEGAWSAYYIWRTRSLDLGVRPRIRLTLALALLARLVAGIDPRPAFIAVSIGCHPARASADEFLAVVEQAVSV